MAEDFDLFGATVTATIECAQNPTADSEAKRNALLQQLEAVWEQGHISAKEATLLYAGVLNAKANRDNPTTENTAAAERLWEQLNTLWQQQGVDEGRNGEDVTGGLTR